jgi:uronate dehydrogenase
MRVADQTWALTGAAGRIASSMRPGLAERVARLRLIDVVPVEPVHHAEQTVRADLRDQAAMTDALQGTDGVLHLGGLADEADFHDLAEVNIVGTFHVFEAARRAGTRRVLYASSNRLTGCYPTSTVVDPEMPPRPDGLYGASKVAGEALGRVYADKFGLEVANVRIGSFEEAPKDERQLSTWLSPADCLAAFLAAMTVPDLTFATFYAVSRNTRRWWSLSAGHALGYDPRDDAEGHAGPLGAGTVPAPGALQGGVYASPSYTLDRQREA